MNASTKYSRPAYTLIELMVVVGLIVFLATLTVAVANSSLVDSYRVVGAADRTSGWLLNAKNRALRDRTPVGVRFIRNSTNPADPEYYFCRSAQLIEMPALYAPVQESDANKVVPLPNANAPDPTLQDAAPFICVQYLEEKVRIVRTVPTTQTFDQIALIQDTGGTNVSGSTAIAGVFLFWPTNVSPFPTFRPQTPTDPNGTDLSPGDLLKINELNSLHRISQIDAINEPYFYTSNSAGLGKPSLASIGQWYKLTLTISKVTLENPPMPYSTKYPQYFPPSPPYPTNLLPFNTSYQTTPVPDISGAPGTTQLYPTGYPALGGSNFYTSHFFGLFRGARPVLGEPILQLPANMAIDMTPDIDNAPAGLSANDILGLSANVPVLAGNYDVIFNPNGSVLFTDANPVVLWLRDTRNSAGQQPLLVTGVYPNILPTPPDVTVDKARLMNAGEHVLVSINTKTGAIATFPIFPPDLNSRYYGGADNGRNGPYKYALKSANTGL